MWTEDRRSEHRRPCTVRFTYFHAGRRRETIMTDASAAGAFIATKVHPPNGSIIALESYHEAAQGLILRFMVQVRRSEEAPGPFAVPGIGVQWRRAYCNRGALVLKAFVKNHLQIDIDPYPFIQREPEMMSGEVYYDFLTRAFWLREAGDDAGPGWFQAQTFRPDAAAAGKRSPTGGEPEFPADDTAPDILSREHRVRGAFASTERSAPEGEPSAEFEPDRGEDTLADWESQVRWDDEFAGPFDGAEATTLHDDPGIEDDRTAVFEAPPSLGQGGVDAIAPAVLDVTYSVGSQHHVGVTSHVGLARLVIRGDKQPPPPDTGVLVRVPVPSKTGIRIVRISGHVAAGASADGTFTLLVNRIDDALAPGAYDRLVSGLLQPAPRP